MVVDGDGAGAETGFGTAHVETGFADPQVDLGAGAGVVYGSLAGELLPVRAASSFLSSAVLAAAAETLAANAFLAFAEAISAMSF